MLLALVFNDADAWPSPCMEFVLAFSVLLQSPRW